LIVSMIVTPNAYGQESKNLRLLLKIEPR